MENITITQSITLSLDLKLAIMEIMKERNCTWRDVIEPILLKDKKIKEVITANRKENIK